MNGWFVILSEKTQGLWRVTIAVPPASWSIGGRLLKLPSEGDRRVDRGWKLGFWKVHMGNIVMRWCCIHTSGTANLSDHTIRICTLHASRPLVSLNIRWVSIFEAILGRPAGYMVVTANTMCFWIFIMLIFFFTRIEIYRAYLCILSILVRCGFVGGRLSLSA